MVLGAGGWFPGGLPGPVIKFGKMADGGATPRDDTMAPVATLLIEEDDDDDILNESKNLNTLMNSLNEVISVHFCAKN